MTRMISAVTSLVATGGLTTPVNIRKGDFKLDLTGTWEGTILILRKRRRINNSQINILAHTAADGQALLTAAAASGIVADELIGNWIYNETDESAGPITDNSTTTVTATLAGGTDNDWDTDDLGSIWTIEGTYTIGQSLIGFEAEDNASYMGVFQARTSGTARLVISK